MTRWLIEKSGTGVEKSGTGIEKSGTGIEKSGTGIEKSGTGIEKSGTGIRKAMLACSLAALTLASTSNADAVSPNGELQLVAENGVLTASWSIDGSIFAGVASVDNSVASISLTELSLRIPSSVDMVGGGTEADVVGGGTGVEVVGGGTGAEVVGGGTGVEVVGGGTGAEVVGGGTGVEVVGGGTGSEVVGGGTGAGTLVVGGGTGSEAIAITVDGGFQMDISLSCNTAVVTVFDSAGYEVVSFDNVKVKGTTSLCSSAGGGFHGRPTADERLK